MKKYSLSDLTKLKTQFYSEQIRRKERKALS